MYVLNHRGSPKWISAVVAKCSGPLSLVVKFPDGREACYHVDHVKAQATKGTVEDGEEMGDDCNPFAGEAEDDNDLVPNILIMVKEPAGCPRMDRRTTSTCSTRTTHGSSCASTLPVITPPDYYGTWSK